MNTMMELGSLDTYLEDLSKYDNHPADAGTEVFMKEQDQGFKNNLKNKLDDINKSIEDLNHNRYGVCTSCSKSIGEKRLDIIPYVKTCIDCSKESSNPDPIFESIDDRYASMTNNNDQTIYDREDSYQDVLKNEIVPGDPSYSTGDYMGLTDEQNEDNENNVENISQEYYDDTLK